jgi:glycosyltransferase involved in cell wall biosynthesis
MDERISVLWLIKGLGPGGAEQLLVSFAKVADHARFRYRVAYVVPWKSALVPKLASLGVPADLIGDELRPGRRWPWRLRRLLLAEGIDVVHVHSPSVAAVARLVALTLPRRGRPVIVSTEHNTWPSYGRTTRVANAVTSLLDARRWAVSQRVHASIWRPFRRSSSVLVHGLVLSELVDHPGQRARLRAEWGATDNSTVVCTVANFRPNKSYPNLLHAARAVVDAHPATLFVSVGQGALADEITALRDGLGLADRFLLLGHRDDVHDILGASDIFALASKHEGFPIAVMEALAAGLPVVATDVGGVTDAVTPGVEGYLVPKGQPRALADALLSLMADPETLHRMSRNARERGQAFDIRNAVRVVEQGYLDCLGSRSGAGYPGLTPPSP